jgi:hypothetical protein
VADSESSSVRIVDIATGATKAVVGADRDPNVSNYYMGGFMESFFDVKI